MQLVVVHRVVAFTQRTFTLPIIKFCNDWRKNAPSDFESSLYKLIANAFYGKTAENIRRRPNVWMISDPLKLHRAVANSSYKRSLTINEDLRREPARENHDDEAIGCATLEIAKLVMHEFYYYCLLPKFGDHLRLCFSDTDSFTCHITSDDLHGELAAITDWLDTSNFVEVHPLYSSANFRTLGKLSPKRAT